MRYLGGKELIAGWVAQHVWSLREGRPFYLEPFLGSCAVFRRLAPHFERAVGSDAHEDLMLMWRAIATGWLPPVRVSRAEWDRLKAADPSALRGFVGFGCSFGGIFFSSYADRRASAWRNGRENAVAQHEARAVACMRPVLSLPGVTLEWADYRTREPGPDTVVYCDPPYAGTTSSHPRRGYSVGEFDSGEFWNVAARWADGGAMVVVSEYRAPVGWREVSSIERWTIVGAALIPRRERTRTEKLFVRGSA